MAHFQSYIICTSPRSGSTLLCKLLEATGLAGSPNSHFHRPSLAAWQSTYNLMAEPGQSLQEQVQAVFRAAVERGRGETDMFGLRLQRHSFDFFMQQLAILHPDLSTDRERIEAAFGPTLFLHLTREDKVAQAVSYVKAEQSGLWHVAPDGTEIERTAPARAPAYDADKLQNTYEEFVRYDADWAAWFETQRISAFPITYSELAAAPNTVLCNVLEQLGLDRSAGLNIQPAVKKLADDESANWVKQLRPLLETP